LSNNLNTTPLNGNQIVGNFIGTTVNGDADLDTSNAADNLGGISVEN
jgi:hypothetical protein